MNLPLTTLPTTSLPLQFGAAELMLDTHRALWWPKYRLLAVADLHLGKASAFSEAGYFLPPYDTQATLRKLEQLIDHYTPAILLSVGDAFHRAKADALLDATDRQKLLELMARVPQWIWITGNHDPIPPNLPGQSVDTYTKDALTFAHERCDAPAAPWLVCGHYHPKVTIGMRGGKLKRPCFAWTESILLMPAYGSLSGGMELSHPSIAPVLGDTCEIMLCDLPQSRRLVYPVA